MFRLIFWLLYGYDIFRPEDSAKHVCEEFTRWEEKACYERQVLNYTDEKGVLRPKILHVTRHWQERRCTTCGKLYQEAIANGAGPLKDLPPDDFTPCHDDGEGEEYES